MLVRSVVVVKLVVFNDFQKSRMRIRTTLDKKGRTRENDFRTPNCPKVTLTTWKPLWASGSLRLSGICRGYVKCVRARQVFGE